jgi:hypothetical protein
VLGGDPPANTALVCVPKCALEYLPVPKFPPFAKASDAVAVATLKALPGVL